LTPEQVALGLIFRDGASVFDKKCVHKYNRVPLVGTSQEEVVYAIIKTGGKQYRVAVGDKIMVERLPNAAGDKVTLDDVLMIENEGNVTVGKPKVSGAQVVATVVDEGKGRKTIHFDYRNKHRRRKTIGHRQQYTRLEISEIRG